MIGKCKKLIVTIICILTMLFSALPVLAARSDGELIFPRELAVGEIVTVQIAMNTNMDAMVVSDGETPRLVLLSNLGTNSVYKSSGGNNSDGAYDLSDLKTAIDSRTLGHGDYIFNISAPFLHDVAKTDGSSGSYAPEFIDRKLMSGPFWTRTPRSNNSILSSDMIYFCGFVYPDGSVISSSFDKANTLHGVRPAFNLKADTVLKYASGKYTISSDANEKAKKFLKSYGFSGIVYVPQGQAPAGYTAVTGMSDAFYKLINDQYLFVYAQEYTPPTNVGNLNIN